MAMGEKLLELRRGQGLSQEDVAEQLGVSRQAVSRWEKGSALPDSVNLLALSDLFGVSADYLLRDELEADGDSPVIRAARERAERDRHRATAFVVLIGCQLLALFWEVTGWYFWKLRIVVLLGFALQLVNVIGFEWIWRSSGTEEMRPWRRKYYRVTAWQIGWCPAWLISLLLWQWYPRPHPAVLEPVSAAALYLLISILLRRWVRMQAL